ncbi:efflux RND transporter periplasmic adaptor subunit [Ralstonia solanacearum]|uniref:efflux RND transporter periplasmic adaptor subunit n=1 Tax=Ralstonia solanacearum TaxID=305 RepID=UPI00030DC116|nr:efflux RND transporter periplasmic adaptor subunit [Ralstonia solanacearum]MDC6177832.1 efflux RND transporter periplasmic adaptor subunit [Ralstonia solanacearum]MDC6210565.1 efflux RND transporter periplasmic adaptor subunit [Ralstonia solanacearum]MDC6240045.1 efflux RND transporter periplasmic adaptor subunit [Ralstonia solanacearum]MDD7800429.1 efflux RND transporter periplasmic adaptor subunit [Ralstonia solanacearum]TYZ55728.1 efflux RND transporter periplasmic adaptor subunit [Ralst
MPVLRLPYPHSDSAGLSGTPFSLRRRTFPAVLGAFLLGGALLLAGCGKEQSKAPEVRPVRTMTVVSEQAAGTVEFSGDVRPRIESRLGFRVPGKIIARLVDVGATVRKGQVLARLDPTDLALAQQSAQAQLQAAKTDRDLAAADLKRFSELFAKGFISAAEQQRHQANYDAAQARYDQAAAGYRNQSNQAAYATLEADADGVVTGVDAEVGQVVSAGQPVVRVAQTAEKEVVVGIPEDQVDALRKSPDVRIKLWADPSRSLPGKVREIAPAADPVTRTYTVKITVPNPPPDLKLGMTAVATFVRPGGGADSGGMGVRVPITALLQEQGKNVVWLYDAASQTVKPVPVTVGAPRDNVLLVTGGLSPGQTIVTAGVHLLKAGQRVMPMAAADQPSAQSAITPRR